MKRIVLLGVLVLMIVGCTQGTEVRTVKDIEVKGSDTLLQLVSNMAEAYSEENPNARISVTGGGSGSGIAALINGEIDIADSSRPIKDKEVQQAEETGTQVLEFVIGRDMLSVIVNTENPVSQLTLDEISGIYKGTIKNWKDVGGQDQEITLYGRQSTSGTYVYFLEEVVRGDYATTMRNMEGNQAILDAVKQDKTGVGYVGLGYLVDVNGEPIDEVTVVDVASEEDSEYISAFDEANRGSYPISRQLFQYFAKTDDKHSAAYQFLHFELSEAGQKIVEETGFVPITAEDVKNNEAMLASLE